MPTHWTISGVQGTVNNREHQPIVFARKKTRKYSSSPYFAGPITIYWLVLAGAVPANKELLAGTVPANKELLAGTVPANKELLAGRVPANNLFLTSNYNVLVCGTFSH